MPTSCTTTNNYPLSSSSSSSITNHSAIASSTASSSSSSSPSSPPTPSRCIGLNLLVKAIHQVTAGSIIGVPYIQHRILTRRKRPIHFHNLIITTTFKPKPKPKGKRQSKDSVLDPLTPKRRSQRTSSSSVKITITNGE